MTPLEDCFNFFPQFKDDFTYLVNKDNGFIKKTETGLLWTDDHTSLSQYFYDFKDKGAGLQVKPFKGPVKGGFWNPIETVFNIEKRKLHALVNNNGQGKKSKGYERIMKGLKPYREKFRDIENFLLIKEIIGKTKDNNRESILQSMDKIKNILFTKTA
jgi:hypothetical protein